MNGKQLKNSILQLAIQGKLVPQDPNDEPASELLKRIRKVKEQLVKDGKLKKKDLESEPISEEEKPFEIPETWEWCRFCEIVKFATNLVPPTQYLDYIHIAPDNIEKGTGKLLECRTVREDKVISNNHLFYKGQIIYSKIRPLLRKCVKAPFDGLCSADMYPLVSYADDDFLMYLLLSDFFNIQVADICASRVKMPKINQEELSNLLLPLPPLSEQHRIVAKIEKLMPLVEEYDKAQTKLDDLNAKLPEALKKSILQEAIQGKLVPQDPTDEPASVLLQRIRKEKEQLVKDGKLKKKDLVSEPISDEEKPFEIPESWEWVRIPDIGISQLGKTKNPHQQTGKNLPYLCSINVYWDGIDLNQTKEMLFEDSEIERYSINKGDLLICEGGDCGRSAIWDKDYTILYQNALHRVRFFGNINSKYILNCLYLYKASNQLDDYIKGETIKHLVKGELDSILFPLPPLSEQHRIVAKIEELFAILK